MPDLRPVVADSRVLALLNEHYSTPVTDLVRVEGGLVARTFAFRTGERDYIIRFNLDRMLNSNFPKEAYVWQKLASTAIPMPPVLNVGRLGDLHYAISLRMPGTTLSNFSPQELGQMFPQIIETIHAIHQVDVADTQGYGVFDDRGSGMCSSWHGFLRQIIDEEEEQDYFGKWHSLFDETFLERAAFEEIYQHMVRLLEFCPEDRYLVQGSLSLANMLALPGKLTAVLDWLDARYGDFVYDVAILDYWTPLLRVRERFQQFYQQREILVPAYPERILCYQCYVTLAAMRFYAKSGQQQSYEYVRGRMLARLRESA
jgi:hygromycin-B 4-O-kinase